MLLTKEDYSDLQQVYFYCVLPMCCPLWSTFIYDFLNLTPPPPGIRETFLELKGSSVSSCLVSVID